MAPVAAEKQLLFALVQAVRIGECEFWLALILDWTNVSMFGPAQNFPGIGQLEAAFLHENGAYVAGRIVGPEGYVFF